MSKVYYSLNYPTSALGAGFGATAGRSTPHKGQDIAPVGGGPALAIADGVLVYKGWSDGLGWVAVLGHADGKFSGYVHLAHNSPILLRAVVRRAKPLGEIGNTGRLSKGRHLHLTVATTAAGAAGGYNVIDPLKWIRSHLFVPKPPRPRTSTSDDGIPGSVYWTMVQTECRARKTYTGPLTGRADNATHVAHAKLQANLLNRTRGLRKRTTTEEDGQTGPRFWTLAQIGGRKYGYRGTVTGKPNAATTKALYRWTATWLNAKGR